MLYRLLADLVTVFHLAFVVFVMLGTILVWFKPRIVWLHVPAAIWGAFIEFSGRICPLTPLEVWLRERGGAEGYAGGFVEHYLIPLLYPANLTSDLQMLLGGAVVAVNASLYVLVWRKHWRTG